MTLFRRLCIAATVATLVQIGSGGLVRATGSGEGCPDWPRCFGRWLPPVEYHSLIEYSHRLIASAAIALVLATAVIAVRRYRKEPRILWPSVVAGATIIVLALIGAAVVKTGLNEALVSVHIAVAMTLVGTLVYATVNAACIDRFPAGKVKEPVDPSIARLTVLALGTTFAVIVLGAEVRGSGAGLVFRDWPFMNGRVVPRFDNGLVVRHFLHRLAALADAGLIGALVVQGWRTRRELAVRTFSTIAAGLFLAQAVVGAAQIWTDLSALSVTLHVWISSLVWAALVALYSVTRQLAAHVVPPEPARPKARAPEEVPL